MEQAVLMVLLTLAVAVAAALAQCLSVAALDLLLFGTPYDRRTQTPSRYVSERRIDAL
jgi:hypothetical protein